MTRYRVPVADPLLEQAEYWTPVKGFRLLSVDGPWAAHPDVTICTFEDDDAPAALEGKLVEPVLTSHADSTVTITARNLVSAA